MVDVGGLGAELDGIELNTLNAPDIPRVVEIQNANRALYTEMQDTLNDIARFVTRPPQGLQSLKKRAPAYIAGGAVVGFLAKGPSAVIGFHPTTTATNSEALKATTASTASSKPTETEGGRVEWFFNTIPDTSVDDFHSFIAGLPDKGIGPKNYYDWPTKYQTYVALLTKEEAEAVNTNAIIDQTVPNKKAPSRRHSQFRAQVEDWQRIAAGRHTNHTRLPPRDDDWKVEQRANSARHLRLMSYNPEYTIKELNNKLSDPVTEYTYVHSLGKGVAIYVVDSGFDFTSRVCRSLSS